MPKRSNAFSRQRRRFMQETLAGLSTLYLASCTEKNLVAGTSTASKKGKYLINIQVAGGFDLHWFTSTVHPDNVDMSDNISQVKDPSSGAVLYEYHNHFTHRHDLGGYLMHPNYGGSTATGIPLGLGFANVFGPAGEPSGDVTTGMDLLREKILLWNGMKYEVGHGIDNRLILHGSLTSYALTYSSLIAGHLAKTNPRPLHYVQMSASPSNFSANWALAKGYEVPINLPNHDSLVKLTTPGANDFQLGNSTESQVLKELNRVVANLGNSAIPAFQLDSSKSVFETFITAFKDAVRVSTSNMMEDTTYNQIKAEYVEYATERVKDLIRKDSFFDKHNLSRKEATGGDLTVPGNPWANIPEALGDPNGETSNPSLGQNIHNAIDSAAQSFAIAEFLIRRDDTAVIDIPCTPLGGDFHSGNDTEVASLTIVFAMIRKLLGNLSKYSVKGDPGTKLIDATTVVMFSEFDRSHNIFPEGNLVRRGTNHGSITSMFLAGAGVNGGRVVGALATDTGPFSEMRQRRAGRYWYGCPVDPVSGEPSASGIEMSVKSIFPTMLTMFDVEVPANQITDMIAIPGVIDPAYVSERRWKALMNGIDAWTGRVRKVQGAS